MNINDGVKFGTSLLGVIVQSTKEKIGISFSTGHGMCITFPAQLLDVFVWLEINLFITISLLNSMSTEVLEGKQAILKK